MEALSIHALAKEVCNKRILFCFVFCFLINFLLFPSIRCVFLTALFGVVLEEMNSFA